MSMPNTADFETLFDLAPISLWLEDYSGLLPVFASWRLAGVTDLASYLRDSPHLLAQCSACFKVLKVNQKTLEVFAASNQAELLQRMGEVFRDDMLQNMIHELHNLWTGNFSYTHQTVNYALDGRRLDVQIHVTVLPGYEATWERVMVSLEDITHRVQAQNSLAASERYARDLFEHSPVSLWVEDFSDVKELLQGARAQGIDDFRVFLNVHPEFVTRCMKVIHVLDVNQQTLRMFGARDKDDLLSLIDHIFRDEMRDSFAEQLHELWQNKTTQAREVVNYSLNGEKLNVYMQFAVLAGHEARWDRVLVSLVDITARKKAEAYLEYLGKHDSLTRLGNRALYVEELNRVSRRGPWPMSILAIDLNGLKRINDQDGHAAGDALLRRAGEVLSSATQTQTYCVARIGGDEFIILMPGSDLRTAHGLRERIASVLELNNQFYPGQHLSMAIGVATSEGPGQIEIALNQADRDMFAAKDAFYSDSTINRRRN
jgi:diguanylate cyclase (GGDEF)-like protein